MLFIFCFGFCIKNHQQKIYLDYNATTPCDKRVVKKMQRYWFDSYGNANSYHRFGFKAKRAIEIAQEKIAKVIHAHPQDIVFTSGSTESNYIALKGLANPKKNHIITCVTEHKSILNVCKKLEKEGFEVTYLPVMKNGLIDLEVFRKAIKSNTGLVSIMWVNNEIGVIQPIKEISYICKEKGIIFHTDAAQALGKIDVDAHLVDCMSITAHKIYGPKGIGALYIKKGLRLVYPYGDDMVRSGTLPTALCVGFGEACALLKIQDYTLYTNMLLKAFLKYGAVVNGDLKHRVSGQLNVRFKKVPMTFVKEVAVSQGAACLKEQSYVLKALGLNQDEISRSFRISMGRFTTEQEIKKIISYLNDG